jgi:hypothetical protein
MFTSTPVVSSESTRFDRPYDTNGSVSPVVGKEPHDDADVQVGGDHGGRGEPDREEAQEGGARPLRDPEPEPPVERERAHERDHPDEAPLLAHVAPREVGVAEREEAVLLPPLSVAHPDQRPEPTAMSDCVSW